MFLICGTNLEIRFFYLRNVIGKLFVKEKVSQSEKVNRFLVLKSNLNRIVVKLMKHFTYVSFLNIAKEIWRKKYRRNK